MLYSDNLLLRSASEVIRPRLFQRLKRFPFEVGEQLWSAGEPQRYVLFPLRGIVSIQLSSGGPHKQIEIGVVGREGLVGARTLLGDTRSWTTAVALTDGEAAWMPRRLLPTYLQIDAFRTAAERYLALFLLMLGETSLCNRVHSVEKLCVGRLLLMHDRTQISSLHVTQDSFSRMLGVRRATVNAVASRLQRQGAIHYERRGRLTIQRPRLESMACSCYKAMKSEFDRFLRMNGGF